MALVKLSHGAAVNPESFKYITIETKQIEGRPVFALTVSIDENSDQVIAYFDDKKEAVHQLKAHAKRFKEDDKRGGSRL